MSVEEEILSEVESSAALTEEAPSPAPEPEVSEPVVEIPASQETVEPKDDFYKNQYENLHKDYTRKAMELAELKTKPSEPSTEPEWTKPEWQPKTWQEAIEAGKQAALREVAPALSEYQQQKQQRELYAQAKAQAEAEMTELKVKDPKLNENQIYQHASKYSFSSLKSAYQNFTAMRDLEKTVQAKVLKDLKIRQSDPVGVSGATSPEDDTPSYEDISAHKSIRSAASAAFRSLKGK